MTATIDLTGQTFNRLTVISRAPRQPNNTGAFWYCQCSCGNPDPIIILGRYLRIGHTKSCGCLQKEESSKIIKQVLASDKANLSHGHARNNTTTRAYSCWRSMRQRCLNPNNAYFEYYGGRGITICQRWQDDFENFIEDMGCPPPNRSIDRIRVNGHYEKNNCRWATKKQQQNNRRDKLPVELLLTIDPVPSDLACPVLIHQR